MEEKMKAAGVFWIEPRAYLQDPFKRLSAVIKRQDVGTVSDENITIVSAKVF